MSILQKEEIDCHAAKKIGIDIVKTSAALDSKTESLRAVEEALKKLTDEKKALENDISEADQAFYRLAEEADLIYQDRFQRAERGLAIHGRLHELGAKEAKEVWTESKVGEMMRYVSTYISVDETECHLAVLGDLSLQAATQNMVLWVLEKRGDIVLRRATVGAVDLEKRTEDGFTLLLLSALMGHKEGVAFLLSNGADLGATTHSGESALFLAALMGHTTIVKLLIERGADIESKCRKGWTSLAVAAGAGQDQIASLIRGQTWRRRQNLARRL